jgi:hypothetical protein
LAAGNAFYLPSPNATPTAWDLYSLPYYHCRIRITISGTNSNLNYQNGLVSPTAGAISVQIRYLPDTAKLPDAVFGVADSNAGWQQVTYSQASNSDILVNGPNAGGASSGALTDPVSKTTANFLLYTSTATGTQDCNVLEIDLLQMYVSLGLGQKADQCYSIYIGCSPSQTPNVGNSNYPNIVIKDADDLTGTTQQAGNPSPAFTNGLSIVSTQRIYLVGGANQQTGLNSSGFNTVFWPNPPDPSNPSYPATSIYAPDVRYGITDLAPTIAVTGQVAVSQAIPGGTPVNPLSFSNGANTTISSASYRLKAVSTPRISIPGTGLVASMPPITRLSLLFTVEKERTN